jgi:hypothetical protein
MMPDEKPTLTVVPTSKYDDLVRRGREARQAVDGAQWLEGELALEVEALHPYERPRDDTGAFLADEARALRRYAEDIDVDYTTLKDYRRVAAAYPRTTRVVGVSWKAHQALAAQEDRLDLLQPGMTARQAQRVASARTAGNTGKPGWHELLGAVGDSLKAGDAAMDKVEAAVGDQVANQKFREKAARYAGWADELAERLRTIAAEA